MTEISLYCVLGSGLVVQESKPEDMTDVSNPVVSFFGVIDDHTMDVPFFEKVMSFCRRYRLYLSGKPPRM